MEPDVTRIRSFDLHAADERIVDVVLIQILDEVACSGRSASVCLRQASSQLTQTRKRQHC